MPWSGAPKLTCDDLARCKTLRKVAGPENRWPGIAEAAHLLLGLPAIVVLIDRTIARAAGTHGLELDHILRRTSFCAWSLLPVPPEVLLVPDATTDARFRQNPVVTGEPYVRCYAGAPLLHGQHRLGSVCCTGMMPVRLQAEAMAVLCNIGAVCVSDMIGGLPLAVCARERTGWKVLCCNRSFKDEFSSDVVHAGDAANGEVLVGSRRLRCSPATSPDTRHHIGYIDPAATAPDLGHVYVLSTGEPDPNPRRPVAADLSSVGLDVGMLVGKGNHGRVHAGRHHGHQVAIKLMALTPSVSGSHINDRMRLPPHANVLHMSRFYMTGPGSGALVMQRCPSGSLQQQIDRGHFRTRRCFFDGTVDLGRVHDYARQIAAGMAHLHTHNVVHGNLHGHNVLVTQQQVPVVSDYLGLEFLAVDSTRSVTHTAPELLREGVLTQGADVYSWCVLLWEMVTGRRAWAGLQPEAVATLKCSGAATLAFDTRFPTVFRELGRDCIQDDCMARPSFYDILHRLRGEPPEKVRDFSVYGDL